MKGDTEGGAAWGRASGRGSPQRGGAGRAMGVRYSGGDILRRCPQKGCMGWGGGGAGAGRERQEGKGKEKGVEEERAGEEERNAGKRREENQLTEKERNFLTPPISHS